MGGEKEEHELKQMDWGGWRKQPLPIGAPHIALVSKVVRGIKPVKAAKK
jgi:hypothetical protein